MRCNPSRWLWGLIPIAMLTWGTYHRERSRVEVDLTERAQTALVSAGQSWAQVLIDGRDAVITGRAHKDGEAKLALEAVREVWGIRTVLLRTDLAAASSPSPGIGPKVDEVAVEKARKAKQDAEAERRRKVAADEAASLKAKQEAEAEAERRAKVAAEEAASLKAKQEAEAEAERRAKVAAEEAASLKAKQEAEAEAERKAKVAAEEAASLKAKKEAEAEAERHAKVASEEQATFKAKQAADAEAERRAKAAAEETATLKAKQATEAEAERRAKVASQEAAAVRAKQDAEALVAQKAKQEADQRAEAKADAEKQAAAKSASERKTNADTERCQRRLSDAASQGIILFGRASSDIDPKSSVTIGRLSEIIKSCPGTKVEVEGYTDSEGEDDRNQKLSERRARAVVRSLVYAGVNGDQLTAVGFGAANPVASNKTAEGMARNRRIEFKVFSN